MSAVKSNLSKESSAMPVRNMDSFNTIQFIVVVFLEHLTWALYLVSPLAAVTVSTHVDSKQQSISG